MRSPLADPARDSPRPDCRRPRKKLSGRHLPENQRFPHKRQIFSRRWRLGEKPPRTPGTPRPDGRNYDGTTNTTKFRHWRVRLAVTETCRRARRAGRGFFLCFLGVPGVLGGFSWLRPTSGRRQVAANQFDEKSELDYYQWRRGEVVRRCQSADASLKAARAIEAAAWLRADAPTSSLRGPRGTVEPSASFLPLKSSRRCARGPMARRRQASSRRRAKSRRRAVAAVRE